VSSITTYLRRNREKLALSGYFLLILALVWPVINMSVDAWEIAASDGGISSAFVRFLRFVVFGAVLDSSHQTVTAVGFGLFASLLLLMTIDVKKRWQAVLLWIWTFIGVGVLYSAGFLFSQFDINSQGAGFVVGAVIGLLAGGGWRIANLLDDGYVEFRRASQAIFVLLSGFVIVSLLELHIIYPGIHIPSDEPLNPEFISNNMGLNGDGLLFNLVVAGAFVVTVNRFVQYDANKMFFILGPRASGKSLFIIGTYLSALERARSAEKTTPLDPSRDLMKTLEAFDRQDTDWIVEATPAGEVRQLSFQYVYGSVFPLNIQISTLDYAGEYLQRLPMALEDNPEVEVDNTLGHLVEGVDQADALILTIDMNRFVNNEPLDMSEYFTVLQSDTNWNVLLIATKADVLIDDFRDEYEVEPHRNFEKFKSYVNQRLCQSENVDSLVAQTNEEIHPVYYQTKVNETGERVPIRDDTGSVMTVGFDDLLEKMGRM